MSIDTSKHAVFDRVTGVSAVYAACLASRGWRVSWFEATRFGRLMLRLVRPLTGGRVEAFPMDYQVGDHKGLAANAVSLAIDLTEDWSASIDSRFRESLLDVDGRGTRWPEAFAKKATMLAARRCLIRLGVLHRIASVAPGRMLFVHCGGWLARACVERHMREFGPAFETARYPALPARLGLVLDAVRYAAALLVFPVRRGVTTARPAPPKLLANRAMTPAGKPRGDDALIDGETIRRDDLLLYYSGASGKPHVKAAVAAARSAGYETVDFGAVPAPLAWLADLRTVKRYWLDPVLDVLKSVCFGTASDCRLASSMLRLRRSSLAWDVFFRMHPVRCVRESGFLEDQAAATMSADRYGVVSIAIQSSENFDPLNEDQRYLAHHYQLVWGRGVRDLWSPLSCANETVAVGYVWGAISKRSAGRRDEIRHVLGVLPGTPLVAVFDTSISRDSFNSPAMLDQFYGALPSLATEHSSAVFIVKPKDMGMRPMFDQAVAFAPEMRNLRWEEALETDTNDLISAADLVISMSQSSTFIEALLNGVPSVAMDMTGRNWEPSVGRGACLVVDNPRDLSELVSEVLSRGIPRGVWEHTMQRVAWNYGEIDGRELDRIRSIVASASLPTEALRQPAALRKPGVFW